MRTTLLTVILCLLTSTAFANVELPALFSNRMVIQRDQPVNVWGKAAPNETVTITLGDKTAHMTAKADGRWQVTLPAFAVLPPNAKPLTLTVEGNNKLQFTDVLIGDVWLCSGQSNMTFMLMNTTDGKADVAASANPNIRLFNVQRAVASEPQFTVKATWTDCNADTTAKFTAVGYYFACQLLKDNPGVPVGLIHSSWGGTNAEAWTPRETLAAHPETTTILTQWDDTMKKFPEMKADFEKNKDRLVAEWKVASEKAKAEGRMPPAEPRLRTGPNTQYQPAGLYNAMITPLAPYALRGVIWYQGEGNAPRPVQYRTLFPAMIKSWRALWQRDDMPFLFVQLPNLARQPEPSKSGWAEIREAQLMTLKLPHTAMAVTIDVGDPKNLHPTNKKPVGERLAYAAEALFGERPPAEGICPYVTGWTLTGNGEMQIRLSPSTAALKTRDGANLRGLVIAGEDKKFVPAKARIVNNTLVVWSETVPVPAAVRYAWADNPDCNLVNAAGLPVSPFRTDKWPTPATQAAAANAAVSAE